MLRQLSPIKLSIFTSLVVSVILVIIYFFVEFLIFHEAKLSVAFLLFLISLLVNFLLIQFVLNRFIYDRIKLIYKKLHIQNLKDKDLIEKPFEIKDILNEVDEEVKGWSESKSNEIIRLKEMEQYRKDFLGNVSHELKTPIFNIQGYILTLLEGGLEDPEINRKYLEKAEKNINRMISIVEDLETISKLEYGQLKLEFAKFDILALTKDIFEACEDRANLKQIKLKIIKNPGAVFVYADEDRIRQVLTNLILNAINYGREKGSVSVELFDMFENILVEVADDGIGIPEEHIPRLFERFYRVDKSRSSQSGGTGLGLAIVKHIIEGHNQTINVSSLVGKGTTFTFTLKKG